MQGKGLILSWLHQGLRAWTTNLLATPGLEPNLLANQGLLATPGLEPNLLANQGLLATPGLEPQTFWLHQGLNHKPSGYTRAWTTNLLATPGLEPQTFWLHQGLNHKPSGFQSCPSPSRLQAVQKTKCCSQHWFPKPLSLWAEFWVSGSAPQREVSVRSAWGQREVSVRSAWRLSLRRCDYGGPAAMFWGTGVWEPRTHTAQTLKITYQNPWFNFLSSWIRKKEKEKVNTIYFNSGIIFHFDYEFEYFFKMGKLPSSSFVTLWISVCEM